MRKMKKLGLMMVMALAIGCGDDDGRGGMDAGNVTFDAGGSTDAGGATDTGIVLTDSGNPMPDAGNDAGQMMCTYLQTPTGVPDAELPGCMAATLTCLMGCSDQTCAQGCYASDMPCQTCVSRQIIACALDMGCSDEFNGINCCGQENGCGMDVQACLSGPCAAANTAFDTCVSGVQTACQAQAMRCFPAAGG